MINDRHYVLAQTPYIVYQQSIARNKCSGQREFVEAAERIFRPLFELAFNILPFNKVQIETPVGRTYRGVQPDAKICGVSVVRSGESMEGTMRDICGAVPIGKILIQRDKKTKLPQLFYSNLPLDIKDRHVFLLEPMIATAGSVKMAVDVLLKTGVPQERIIVVNFIASPQGASSLLETFSEVKMVSAALEEGLNQDAFMLPGIGDFGDRFFGTNEFAT